MAGGRSQRHMREIRGRDSGGSEKGKTGDPRVLTVPTKAGTATLGQTLTGTNGTFKANLNDPNTITRQWVRETVAGVQTVIAGQTGATYVIAAADQGKKVRFQNTAVNSKGTTISQSTPTGVIP